MSASTAPFYREQQGLDGSQLFQDLGALYLTQEQTGKSRNRAETKQDPKIDYPLQDSRNNRAEPQAHSTEPGETFLMFQWPSKNHLAYLSWSESLDDD